MRDENSPDGQKNQEPNAVRIGPWQVGWTTASTSTFHVPRSTSRSTGPQDGFEARGYQLLFVSSPLELGYVSAVSTPLQLLLIIKRSVPREALKP